MSAETPVGGRPASRPVPDLPDLTRLPEPDVALLERVWPGFHWLALHVWRTTVHHAERVPDGPAVLAVNHVGVFDGPLAVALVPHSQALAKTELWRHGLLGRFMTAVGQVPVDRANVDPGAMRRCVQVLEAARRLAIFPESHRGAGDFGHFKGGAAYLALVTGAPVVPVALLGTSVGGVGVRSIPRPGREVHVVFGEPIAVEPMPWPRTKQRVAEVTADLQAACQRHVRQAQAETGMTLPKFTG